MADGIQLSFSDGLLSCRRIINKLSKHLHQLDQSADWQPLLAEISIIDQTDLKPGWRPHTSLIWIIKTTFLQHMFSLTDPELEDQLVDRPAEFLAGISSSMKGQKNIKVTSFDLKQAEKVNLPSGRMDKSAESSASEAEFCCKK